MKNTIIYIIAALYLVHISCIDRNSNKYVLKKYNEIKEIEIDDFVGWEISQRGENLGFGMYYKSTDSSRYEYYESGEAVPFTKYRMIGFMVNQDFDSLYWLNGENTEQFHTGLENLSNYNGKDSNDLGKVIRSNFRKFKKYNFSEIIGYPWDSTCFFIINEDTHLLRLKTKKAINGLKRKGYTHISGDWWYLIDIEDKDIR